MAQHFIGGRWVGASSGQTLPVLDPANGEPFDTIPRGTAADIDDIGNARYTDRVEKDLFHVLESRRRFLRPVFVSVNGKGSDLEASLSEHTARPIVNRLRHDVCDFYSIPS